jgi:hypothetical protein
VTGNLEIFLNQLKYPPVEMTFKEGKIAPTDQIYYSKELELIFHDCIFIIIIFTTKCYDEAQGSIAANLN